MGTTLSDRVGAVADGAALNAPRAHRVADLLL